MNQQESKYPPWDKIITHLFKHLFVIPDQKTNDLEAPFLLRVNNHIFFETFYESNFSPDVLVSIRKDQYPQIFDYLKKEETSENAHFRKYLIDKEERLLIPEIPLDLRHQLTNFYDLLIKTFHFLSFEKDEIADSQFVLDYLVTVRDFLNPKNLLNT